MPPPAYGNPDDTYGDSAHQSALATRRLLNTFLVLILVVVAAWAFIAISNAQ